MPPLTVATADEALVAQGVWSHPPSPGCTSPTGRGLAPPARAVAFPVGRGEGGHVRVSRDGLTVPTNRPRRASELIVRCR